VRPALSFSLLLALAAALSLSLKARSNDYSTAPDEARLIRDLSAKLERQGFATRVESHLFTEQTVIATRGGCRLRITNGTRANEIAPVLSAQSRDLGVPRYYYDGEWSPTPTIFRAEWSRYLQLTLARLGVKRPRDVVLVVAASQGCKQDRFDLSGMKINMMD
jgi:hypothetical protein